MPRILVIDEAELSRKVFNDDLNRIHQHKNQEMLEFLILCADVVIVADATLSQETIAVLSTIDPKGKWFNQENTFQSSTALT